MSSPTTTEIAFHDIRSLEAKAYDTTGAPLVLMIETSYGKAEIILYMDDAMLASMLKIAIDDALHAHRQQKPPAAETAAYAAASYFYNGGQPVSAFVTDMLAMVVIGGLIALIYIAVLSSLPGSLK